MDLDDDDYPQRAPLRHRDTRDRDRDIEPPRPVASGRIPSQYWLSSRARLQCPVCSFFTATRIYSRPAFVLRSRKRNPDF